MRTYPITRFSRTNPRTANFFNVPNIEMLQGALRNPSGLRNLSPQRLGQISAGVGAGVGTIGGGIAGNAYTPEDAAWQDRLGRIAAGAGGGAALGAGAGYGGARLKRAIGTRLNKRLANQQATAYSEALPPRARQVSPEMTANAQSVNAKQMQDLGIDEEYARQIAGERQYSRNVTALADFYSNPRNYANFNYRY